MPDGAPAFVDLSRVYDATTAEAALEAAERHGTTARSGVYAAVTGPSYETPAEAAFLRASGATVVGMSVVPETVPAHALGLRVAALVCVTNAVGASVDHADVVAVSSSTGRAIGEVVGDVLRRTIV
jgi:purine-nucleoside phosphorylase